MPTVARRSIAILMAVLVAGCTDAPPTTSFEPGVTVDCGPITDRESCMSAAAVAATAKINPPPIAEIRMRRPRPDDDCITSLHPCDGEDLIVTIQSGDTIQDVALTQTTNGWIRIDLIR
jgi:hypothetical protein